MIDSRLFNVTENETGKRLDVSLTVMSTPPTTTLENVAESRFLGF
jgi:hypothetical protein